MKKIILFLIILTGFFSCSKDENAGLQDDVNKLKERLDAIENGKTVINVEFTGTNMIITYSSGEKVTLPIPKGLDGLNGKDGTNGTNGSNGVGIQSIVYDSNTGILKITLTNGNISSFKIIANGSSLSAVLLSDINGSYMLTNASMGSLSIANITYNDKNQILSIVNNVIDERQQVKNVEITNEYSNGKLVNVFQKRFATATKEDWDYNYYGSSTPYRYTYISDNQLTVGDVVYLKIALKVLDTKVIELRTGSVKSSTKRTDGKWSNELTCSDYIEWNLISSSKVGDVITNDRYAIENGSNGLIKSITRYHNDATVPEYQLRLTYNTIGKIVKSEKFVMVNNVWTSTGTYLVYEYNQINQVNNIRRFTPDGKSEKIQETVYDKYGNPIEIHALQGAVYSSGWDRWYNPETNQFMEGQLIKPAGFRLLAKFEYDYQLKNFFGNTISAINPLLDHYKVVNAVKRAWSADEYGMNGWITYQDYNEFGYPQTAIVDGTLNTDGNTESGRLEIRLTYQKKK